MPPCRFVRDGQPHPRHEQRRVREQRAGQPAGTGYGCGVPAWRASSSMKTRKVTGSSSATLNVRGCPRSSAATVASAASSRWIQEATPFPPPGIPSSRRRSILTMKAVPPASGPSKSPYRRTTPAGPARRIARSFVPTARRASRTDGCSASGRRSPRRRTRSPSELSAAERRPAGQGDGEQRQQGQVPDRAPAAVHVQHMADEVDG